MYGEILDIQFNISNGSRESFKGEFTAKIDFPIGYFMLLLLMLTLEVKSLSIVFGPHTGEI